MERVTTVEELNDAINSRIVPYVLFGMDNNTLSREFRGMGWMSLAYDSVGEKFRWFYVFNNLISSEFPPFLHAAEVLEHARENNITVYAATAQVGYLHIFGR
jgi:hypothetical protein